jgi:Ca-activated chloride channel homolog
VHHLTIHPAVTDKGSGLLLLEIKRVSICLICDKRGRVMMYRSPPLGVVLGFFICISTLVRVGTCSKGKRLRLSIPNKQYPQEQKLYFQNYSTRLAAQGWRGCLVLLFLLGISALLPCQTVDQEVHITPRSKSLTEINEQSFVKSHTTPFKVKVDLVLVPVTVEDSTGRLVTGLEKDNFRVYENKEKQMIAHFSSEDAPVSMGMIFDMSGSMSSKIERAREAVVEFFKTANPQDEFFMVTFSEKPQEAADFTSSVEEIQSKLIYTVPKGRTALLDAIYLGISKMRQAKHGKKAILIISDGGDNYSRYTEGEIKSLVKEADTLIYAIGIYDHYFPTMEERLGPGLLSEITEITGGRTFSIDNPNDLADIATKIGIELRNQYVLGYLPKNAVRDGKWHKIRVKLLPPRGLPQLIVRAKQGYYAPAD